MSLKSIKLQEVATGKIVPSTEHMGIPLSPKNKTYCLKQEIIELVSKNPFPLWRDSDGTLYKIANTL